ncbi:peptidylprolyl isomerase [Mariniflexile ostreae]|uniref:Peptidylprolyl isomerase n=1 Tax=Mariniflexile ostreae TaxID=1520892 RepID=A0ABV5FAN2_9FLAO
MDLKYILTFLLVCFLLQIKAQTVDKTVLFTIDDAPVYTSEFLRVYNKNLDLVQDESQKDVDAYLSLFINYKLKLKEARTLGLDTNSTYLNELESYRKQLVKSFLTDSKVTDALVKEAYERISHEVNANHILVRVSENASPKDTLEAYNKAIKLRERALKEGFEVVRKDVHNGQTVFGEVLGYFNGFKMVYEFEDVAYNTEVGAISMPFRTRFGYHFIKVFDVRKSRGEVTVAHIMINKVQADTTAGTAKSRINEIYKKIQQGEDFESLAKQFSEDKNSAVKGGIMPAFTGGQLSAPEFEDAAFSLKAKGDVSAPVQSKFGWHIIKLYDKKAMPAFENMVSELETKIKRDDRSKVIDNALVSKLKEEYQIQDVGPDLEYFVSILNDDYYSRTWKLPTDFDGTKPLIAIKEKQVTYNDFAEFLLESQGHIKAKLDFERLVAQEYNAFLEKRLKQYKEGNLEKENAEFAHTLNEYREGLLLFDLMESAIWNVYKTDSIAIKAFYESHKKNYLLPERVDAVIASSANKRVVKKIGKLLEGHMLPEQIKNLVNADDEVNVVFTSGIFEKGHQALPSRYTFEKGISKAYKHNNAFVLVQAKEVFPEGLKTFDEAKGHVISDYQTAKENDWIERLKEKYKIIINQDALKRVKAQIKKQ